MATGTLARFTPYDLSGSEVWGFETAADGGYYLTHFEQTGVDADNNPVWGSVLR